jgi:tRNA1(Val) A37 N6-methylase TrmN6
MGDGPRDEDTAERTELPPICNTEPTFRGWAKPGPLPAPGVELEARDDETIDALCGHFRIVQLADGHRFSTDDLLCAWYGTSWAPSVARALDLGSGIGTVAMVAAWRLRGARFVTVEAQSISVELARRSTRYNGLDDRFEIRLGDFREPGVLDADERFDLVTGSPPYLPPGEGVHSDHPQREACRFELRGGIEDYCETAARHLAPGGLFACVFAAGGRERVEEAARRAELAIVRARRVELRAGGDYALMLFAMTRARDLPDDYEAGWSPDASFLEPPLVVRDRRGQISSEYAAVKHAFGFPP